MRLGVPIITVVALAFHLILGCQWHTAHAHHAECHAHRTVPSDHHAPAAHDHHDTPESPPAESGCEAGPCVYIITAPVLPSTIRQLDSAPMIEVAAPATIGGAGMIAGVEPPRAMAAVRPHLLFQVFLI